MLSSLETSKDEPNHPLTIPTLPGKPPNRTNTSCEDFRVRFPHRGRKKAQRSDGRGFAVFYGEGHLLRTTAVVGGPNGAGRRKEEKFAMGDRNKGKPLRSWGEPVTAIWNALIN